LRNYVKFIDKTPVLQKNSPPCPPITQKFDIGSKGVRLLPVVAF